MIEVQKEDHLIFKCSCGKEYFIKKECEECEKTHNN